MLNRLFESKLSSLIRQLDSADSSAIYGALNEINRLAYDNKIPNNRMGEVLVSLSKVNAHQGYVLSIISKIAAKANKVSFAAVQELINPLFTNNEDNYYSVKAIGKIIEKVSDKSDDEICTFLLHKTNGNHIDKVGLGAIEVIIKLAEMNRIPATKVHEVLILLFSSARTGNQDAKHLDCRFISYRRVMAIMELEKNNKIPTEKQGWVLMRLLECEGNDNNKEELVKAVRKIASKIPETKIDNVLTFLFASNGERVWHERLFIEAAIKELGKRGLISPARVGEELTLLVAKAYDDRDEDSARAVLGISMWAKLDLIPAERINEILVVLTTRSYFRRAWSEGAARHAAFDAIEALADNGRIAPRKAKELLFLREWKNSRVEAKLQSCIDKEVTIKTLIVQNSLSELNTPKSENSSGAASSILDEFLIIVQQAEEANKAKDYVGLGVAFGEIAEFAHSNQVSDDALEKVLPLLYANLNITSTNAGANARKAISNLAMKASDEMFDFILTILIVQSRREVYGEIRSWAVFTINNLAKRIPDERVNEIITLLLHKANEQSYERSSMSINAVAIRTIGELAEKITREHTLKIASLLFRKFENSKEKFDEFSEAKDAVRKLMATDKLSADEVGNYLTHVANDKSSEVRRIVLSIVSDLLTKDRIAVTDALSVFMNIANDTVDKNRWFALSEIADLARKDKIPQEKIDLVLVMLFDKANDPYHSVRECSIDAIADLVENNKIMPEKIKLIVILLLDKLDDPDRAISQHIIPKLAALEERNLIPATRIDAVVDALIAKTTSDDFWTRRYSVLMLSFLADKDKIPKEKVDEVFTALIAAANSKSNSQVGNRADAISVALNLAKKSIIPLTKVDEVIAAVAITEDDYDFCTDHNYAEGYKLLKNTKIISRIVDLAEKDRISLGKASELLVSMKQRVKEMTADLIAMLPQAVDYDAGVLNNVEISSEVSNLTENRAGSPFTVGDINKELTRLNEEAQNLESKLQACIERATLKAEMDDAVMEEAALETISTTNEEVESPYFTKELSLEMPLRDDSNRGFNDGDRATLINLISEVAQWKKGALNQEERELCMKVVHEFNELRKELPLLYSLRSLSTLAEASPRTVEYLRAFGENEQQAEAEYNLIRSAPDLYEYYLTFVRLVSCAVAAGTGIQSRMLVAKSIDSESLVNYAGKVIEIIDQSVKAIAIPGVPVITGVLSFLIGAIDERERRIHIERLTKTFPAASSHVFIEMLARQLTLSQQKEINEYSVKPVSAFAEAYNLFTWLKEGKIKTSIEAFAIKQATTFIDKVMKTEPAIIVDNRDHLPRLIVWATGGDLKEHIAIESSTSVCIQPQVIVNVGLPKEDDVAEQMKAVMKELNTLREVVKDVTVQLARAQSARYKLERKVETESALSGIITHILTSNGGLTQVQDSESMKRALDAYSAGSTPWHQRMEDGIGAMSEVITIVAENMNIGSMQDRGGDSHAAKALAKNKAELFRSI